MATKPSVSDSEGITKMSAEAYAALRSSPFSMPCTETTADAAECVEVQLRLQEHLV